MCASGIRDNVEAKPHNPAIAVAPFQLWKARNSRRCGSDKRSSGTRFPHGRSEEEKTQIEEETQRRPVRLQRRERGRGTCRHSGRSHTNHWPKTRTGLEKTLKRRRRIMKGVRARALVLHVAPSALSKPKAPRSSGSIPLHEDTCISVYVVKATTSKHTCNTRRLQLHHSSPSQRARSDSPLSK